tara:strand:- start:102097 stop:102798 length:702 start_codon:yes stop_codon:yes gene_type:complete
MTKKILALALASAATCASIAPANAALIINSITAANSGAPTGTLKAGSNYSVNAKITPFNVTGVLDGEAVSLFTYCVDIYQYAHTGTFEVVSLSQFLGGNTAKANAIAALISNQGADGSTQHDAAVQLALWELLYEKSWNTPDLTSDYFRVSPISDSAARTLATSYANLARTSWLPSDNIVISVAKSGKHQDQLFWSYTPSIPEPSTWAMLLLGFGTIGATMRRQRVKTKISFA